jgi:hypothetical protein
MNALAKQENTAVATTTEAAALIQVISRAASDPSVDVNKLERLMAMHEQITAREAEKAFYVAMTACQLEIKQVAPDADNPQTRSKYATYAKLDSVLRPVYTKHGFSLSFDEGESKPDMVRVICYVSHIGGHSRTYHRDMPADGKGAKGGDVMTKTHAAGAAGSYGARYLLKGIFNVAIGEYDNDGNSGGGMDEGEIADFLAAIDGASNEEELRTTFGKAWTKATAAKDKGAQRLLTQHKDARKKALKP